MNRTIELVVHKRSIHENDFAFWNSQPYEARIAALEEIRREYHQWLASQQEDGENTLDKFHRVVHIVKRSEL